MPRRLEEEIRFCSCLVLCQAFAHQSLSTIHYLKYICSTKVSVISTKSHHSSAMEAELSRSLQAAKIDSSSRHAQPAGLLELPLELRQQIYAYALIHTMTPSPEEIYFPDESFTSLPPASLYFVNWQIHIELHATLAKINT